MSNFKVPKSLVFLRKNKEFQRSASLGSVAIGHPYPPSDSLPVINIDQRTSIADRRFPSSASLPRGAAGHDHFPRAV